MMMMMMMIIIIIIIIITIPSEVQKGNDNMKTVLDKYKFRQIE